jgi:hypothetical protein
MKALHEYTSITVHEHEQTGQWFFSTDHCQEFEGDKAWVPITFYSHYTPEEVREIEGAEKEVENPDINYVPDWWWEL